jgi:7-cyano-7-deazaguanine reductase
MATYAKTLSNLTLGKTTTYSGKYNPDLLQGVPRSLNRDDLALSEHNLPFVGQDVWYGYEVSWLTMKGLPVVAVAEFRFPCTSVDLVESKSFKLYLNSFNQTRFESWHQVTQRMQQDLSKVVSAPAKVALFPLDQAPALAIGQHNAVCIDQQDIEIDNYDYQPQILAEAQKTNTQATRQSANTQEYLVSHLLKSNCLITNQPDWASVFIRYSGKTISHSALLKYLISFRQHNEFHEQCVERIFCDIKKWCSVDQLTVFARYTRRGGLDINPFRSTHITHAPDMRMLRQ